MEIKTGTHVQIEGANGVISRLGEWHQDWGGECVLLNDGTRLSPIDLLTRFYVIQLRDNMLRLGHVEDGEQHVDRLVAENEALRARLADLDALVSDVDHRDEIAEMLFNDWSGRSDDWSTAPDERKAPAYELAEKIIALRAAYQNELLRDYERAMIRLRSAHEENAGLRILDTYSCVRYRHMERLEERQRIIDRQGRILACIGYTDNGTWSPDPQTRARIEQLEAALANVKPTEGGD